MSTSKGDFAHLHVHTEYSMLDGASLLDGLFERTAELGMTSIAMTDHGNMHGAFDFWKKAKKHGINPIIGIEAYIAPDISRHEKRRVRWGSGTGLNGSGAEEGGNDVAGGGSYTHMTMWAETTEGMHNLFRLSSLSSLEGYYYKPRMDHELLSKHAKGLIASTGCPSGAIQTRLRLGQYDEARRTAGELQEIFGRDSFFLELMDHGLGIERQVRDDLLRLGKELGIRPIATNDSHYNLPGDADAHDALICVASGKRISDPNRLKFDGGGYYIKSAEEMRALWADQFGMKEACDNTLLIAERCHVEFQESTGGYMARAFVPEGETEQSWFAKEVWRGVEERYPGAALTDEVRARTEMELDVITQKGYCGYYLVVADFINWAKNNGVRVGPGRGSGAGSIAAYALRITDLCPLTHGLIFERFLNPERASMPDFDIDFDDRRRGDVIGYVTSKYGSDRVAQIATFGRLKSKQALKDAARVLDYDYGVGERITKSLPPDVMGKGVPLKKLFDPAHDRYADGAEFRALHEADADVRRIYDTALGLEGQIRQTGVHAAGVIMSSDPLIDIVPIMMRQDEGATVTQFDYPMCEALGLVKMDFLGLRNLTVLDDALANIKRNHGVDLVLEDLALDDAATYELLGRGETLGVFQLDNPGMQSLLKLMQPDNFEDISAVLALYRPGPMGVDSHTNYALRKNGKQAIKPIHAELEEPLAEILGTTYGLIVYQEQVMSVAQKVANYSLGAADELRRAMGKKKKEILEKEYVPFSEGMRANGYSEAAVKALWDVLVPFSDYAFNKAHTAAYGLISYWTAWLKAHYAPEYMAALLESVKDSKDKLAVYLNECRRMKISVLPPDVNESASTFTPVGADVRFGLSAIRNVGEGVVDGVVAAREESGKFLDFNDFMRKIPASACNKKVLESLVKAGAFDSLGHTRRGLFTVYEGALDQYSDLKKNEAIGQDSLFEGLDDSPDAHAFGITVAIPDIEEWDKTTLLAHERDMLGLYVSDHPLLGLEDVLAEKTTHTIGQLLLNGSAEGGGFKGGETVSVAGLITKVDRRISKKGDPWAQVTVEDLEGAVTVRFFSTTYQLVAPLLEVDAIVRVTGAVAGDDETVELRGIEVVAIDTSTARDAKPVTLLLPATRCTPQTIDDLKEVLSRHAGETEVLVHVRGRASTDVLRLGRAFRVAPTAAFFADIKALLGPTAIG